MMPTNGSALRGQGVHFKTPSPDYSATPNIEPLFVSGFGQFHTNEPAAENPNKKLTPYVTINLPGIRALVDNPQSVDKAKGQWLIASTLPCRTFATQEQSGEFWMLWADLDLEPKPLDEVAEVLDAIIPGCDREQYTSRSAQENNPKSRILIPLIKPLCGGDYLLCQEVLNDKLAERGLTPDRATEGAGQLCYLPNRGDFYKFRSVRDDNCFDPLTEWAPEIAAKRAAIAEHERVLHSEAQAAAIRREALKLDGDNPDLIGAFNAAYTVQDILVRAGYKQRGNTFRHPHSESGSYSASVKGGRVHSMSSSDPLYTGGGGVGAHDAFSAFCVLFASGELSATLKLAGEQWLSIGGESWNTVKQRDYMRRKAAEERSDRSGSAGAAARAVGGLVAIPDFGTDRPDGVKDFNDMAQLRGVEAVKRAIANAIAPAMAEPQPGTENAVSRFTDTVELIDGASIKPEAVRWLWEGYLARGKLHVLAGAPGTGKTMIALALAATVSTGGRWPDGTHCEPGNVLIWSAEDDIADTLVPRLIAMGADMHKIRFVGDKSTMEGREPFDPARDMPMLLRTVAGAGEINLLIVDPIVSAVAGDSHKNAEVRRGLQPLVDVGHKLGAAVLGISHFSKGTAGREVTERVTGSLAFGALARVVLAAAKRSDEDGGGRIFARAKSNIGPDGGGFAYDLAAGTVAGHPGIDVHVLQWGSAIEGSARELLANAEDTGDTEGRSATDEAQSWLTDLLADGPMKAADAQKEACQAGIADKPLRTARERLHVKPYRQGFSGGWWWKLPTAQDAQGAQDAHVACTEKQGILDSKGHLGQVPDLSPHTVEVEV